MGDHLSKRDYMMRCVIILAVVAFSCVSSQRGPFGGGPFGRGPPGGRPKCEDGSKPTCTCDNGDVITRPRPNPCGDGTKPNCLCADGSAPAQVVHPSVKMAVLLPVLMVHPYQVSSVG